MTSDDLNLETEGERIALRRLRQKVTLKKELGVWVYHGEHPSGSIADLIDLERETHIREITEAAIECARPRSSH